MAKKIIIVDEDLGAMSKGIDPQLERAITEIKAALLKGYNAPKQPGYEKRNNWLVWTGIWVD